MGINKGSNRYRNKRYTKNRYSNKKRNSNKRYTKKHHTKKRYNKKRYTKKRYTKKNINKNVRKYLGGDSPYVDITRLLENTPRSVRSKLFCSHKNTLLKFGNENEEVTCVDKTWGKCIRMLKPSTIQKYLLNEGVYSGESKGEGDMNPNEVSRNFMRLVGVGIHNEIDSNVPVLVVDTNSGDTSSTLDNVYNGLLAKFNLSVADIDIINRISLSMDTTKAVGIWQFAQLIQRELNGLDETAPLDMIMPHVGESGRLIKQKNGVIITFNYYYLQMGCEWTWTDGGVINRSNIIVRSYNTYNLKDNEEWNSFNIQIKLLNPESVRNTIDDIIIKDKDFRDGVMEAMEVLENNNLKTIINKFPKLTEHSLSDEYINKIADYYCSTDSLSVDYDISLLERITTKTKGITNILRNLEEIREIIEVIEDPTCRMKMINNMVDKPIHDDINNLLLTNPDANIYDWLSTSDFTSDTGGKKVKLNYGDKYYFIPHRTISGKDWIDHWNKATKQNIQLDDIKELLQTNSSAM